MYGGDAAESVARGTFLRSSVSRFQLLALSIARILCFSAPMLVRDLFDATAKTYDATRRQLVPCFDDFYRTAVELIPFADDATIRVVDLGAGTGLLAALVTAAFPNASLTLIDVSSEMLAGARERFAAQAQRFVYQVGDLAIVELPPCDVVISGLAIHHLEDDVKAELFARIYDALQPDGVFINADQVLAPTAATETRNRDTWRRHAREAGASDADLAMAAERMRADHTALLSDQLRMLEEAGFGDVDCSYKNYMFAVYSGRKTLAV